MSTEQHKAGTRKLLGYLEYLLARKTPEELAEHWQDLFPNELAYNDVYSGFQAMLPEELLSLQQGEQLLFVVAAAFVVALTADVEGPPGAAAEEPQTSSAECEDV